MERRPLSPPVLEDRLVRLRPFRVDDAERTAAAFRDDPEIGRLGGWDADPTVEELRERVDSSAKAAAKGSMLLLAIADPADDQVLGDLILHHVDWAHERAELGFWLAREARGAGRAAAAIRLLLGWTFAAAGLHRIVVQTLPENTATLRLVGRVGFQREGLLRDLAIERGVRVSVEQHALLATDPPARQMVAARA